MKMNAAQAEAVDMIVEIETRFPIFKNSVLNFAGALDMRTESLVGCLVMLLAELQAELKHSAGSDVDLHDWLQSQIDRAREEQKEQK